MNSAKVSLVAILVLMWSAVVFALPHPDVVPGKTYVDLEFKVKVVDSPGEKAGSWGLTLDFTFPLANFLRLEGELARSFGAGPCVGFYQINGENSSDWEVVAGGHLIWSIIKGTPAYYWNDWSVGLLFDGRIGYRVQQQSLNREQTGASIGLLGGFSGNMISREGFAKDLYLTGFFGVRFRDLFSPSEPYWWATLSYSIFGQQMALVRIEFAELLKQRISIGIAKWF